MSTIPCMLWNTILLPWPLILHPVPEARFCLGRITAALDWNWGQITLSHSVPWTVVFKRGILPLVGFNLKVWIQMVFIIIWYPPSLKYVSVLRQLAPQYFAKLFHTVMEHEGILYILYIILYFLYCDWLFRDFGNSSCSFLAAAFGRMVCLTSW